MKLQEIRNRSFDDLKSRYIELGYQTEEGTTLKYKGRIISKTEDFLCLQDSNQQWNVNFEQYSDLEVLSFDDYECDIPKEYPGSISIDELISALQDIQKEYPDAKLDVDDGDDISIDVDETYLGDKIIIDSNW